MEAWYNLSWLERVERKRRLKANQRDNHKTITSLRKELRALRRVWLPSYERWYKSSASEFTSARVMVSAIGRRIVNMPKEMRLVKRGKKDKSGAIRMMKVRLALLEITRVNYPELFPIVVDCMRRGKGGLKGRIRYVAKKHNTRVDVIEEILRFVMPRLNDFDVDSEVDNN